MGRDLSDEAPTRAGDHAHQPARRRAVAFRQLRRRHRQRADLNGLAITLK